MPHLTSFRPALYVMVTIGVAAFAVASGSMGMLVLGLGAIGVNAWLLKTRRFRPLPRLAANLITIAALVYVVSELRAPGAYERAVMVIGEFLVLLQLVKLWEQRQNRDYGQLVVLSALLMVAAAINTTSVLFGLVMVAYMLLALYVCLLFHLKVETDRARDAGAAAADPDPTPATARRDRRRLNQSMRRLTAAVSVAGMVGAVLVFLLFPRGTGGATAGPFGGRPSRGTSVGLNNKIDYGRRERIAENQDPIAHVQVSNSRTGRWYASGDVLYLRQTTLERYLDRSHRSPGQWVRRATGEPREGGPADTVPASVGRDSLFDTLPGDEFPAVWPVPDVPRLQPAPADAGPPAAELTGLPVDRIVQRVVLTPTRQQELLAVAGAVSVSPDRDLKLQKGSDGTIKASEAPVTPIAYTVVSTGRPAVTERDVPPAVAAAARLRVSSRLSIDGRVLLDVRPATDRPLPLEPGQLPQTGDEVLEIDGRPVVRLPAAERTRAVDEAAAAGLQLTVRRDGRVEFAFPVVIPMWDAPNPAGRTIGARVVSWASPFQRAFGPRTPNPSVDENIVEVDGKSLADVPAGGRLAAVIDALRQNRPVGVTRSDVPRRQYPTVAPEVESYARRPEVSGTDEKGAPLAAQRDRNRPTPHPLDGQIARSIEAHLRSEFRYTLDLSDADMPDGSDPIAWFLSDKGRRGHCTYFAGAMTLMCQSLGMTARVAVGVRSDEYNPFSKEFVVRQSHAHAWVEVLTPDGWETFDPTTSRGADQSAADFGFLSQLRHLFDWLESGYAKNVLYYNNDSRDNLINSVEASMTEPMYRGVNGGWITRRFTDSKLYKVLFEEGGWVPRAAGGAVALVAVWFGGRWAWRRWRLRRVADRVGLDSLPADARLRLAEQLVFYDDLLRVLERRRLVRRPSQTPLEFARSLLVLPADAYDAVHRLTGIFYRVRYGGQELSPALRGRLHRVVAQLEGELGQAAT
ncbi:MAG TPA: DUF3488 and transglutaminase-like domain-containing protein [Humisphaera sp.]